MKIIVQIGVADGRDHVYDFISEYGFDQVFGIFVEPNKYSTPLIRKLYEKMPSKIISNFAVDTKSGLRKMYFNNYESGNSMQASFDLEHLIAHNRMEKDLTIVDINCIRLDSFLSDFVGFDESNIVDNLFIDTEGYDCPIILSTDFSKFQINEIYFEMNHSEGPFTGMDTETFRETRKHLESFGYVFKGIDKRINCKFVLNR